MDPEQVVLAEILRVRGIQGEVVARSQTDVPGRIERLTSAHARLVDGSDVPVEIAAAWQHKGDWVLRFSGIDSIEAAELFRGADLWVPFADRGALAAGDFFQSDLIGCRVIDNAKEEAIGIVTGWQHYGGPPLMEVQVNGREALIPFVAAECSVDLPQRTIRMDLPGGLLEL